MSILRKVVAFLSIALVPVFATTHWSSAGTMSVSRFGFCVGAIGTKIFVAGGANVSPSITYFNTVEVYDTTNSQWSTLGTGLSAARWQLACGVVGTRLLVAGGIDSTPKSAVDIYDTSNEQWLTPGVLSVARASITVAVSGTKVVFAGGYAGATLLATVDIYDSSANGGNGGWGAATALPGGQRYVMQSATMGTRVFFIGGYTQVYPSKICSELVETYAVDTGVWDTSTFVLSEAGRLASAALAFPASGGTVYSVGGSHCDGSFSSTSDLFHVSPSSTTETFPLSFIPSGGQSIGAVITSTGGSNYALISFNSTWAVYDAANTAWSLTDSLASDMTPANLVTIPNTQKLFALATFDVNGANPVYGNGFIYDFNAASGGVSSSSTAVGGGGEVSSSTAASAGGNAISSSTANGGAGASSSTAGGIGARGSSSTGGNADVGSTAEAFGSTASGNPVTASTGGGGQTGGSETGSFGWTTATPNWITVITGLAVACIFGKQA